MKFMSEAFHFETLDPLNYSKDLFGGGGLIEGKVFGLLSPTDQRLEWFPLPQCSPCSPGSLCLPAPPPL